MGDLSLKQITNRLNEEFNKEDYYLDSRKIIFWYDENKEFEEDIKILGLKNAKVHYLTPTNQFKTKLLLEREDKNSNYLIYAPFSRPLPEDNHLEDILRYSKQFIADRIASMRLDLGIDEDLHPVLEKYRDYFRAESRRNRFINLKIEDYTENSIELGLLSAITKLRLSSFEEALRKVLIESLEDSENRYLKELEKYNLLDTFWEYCKKYFGYQSVEPSLLDLFSTLLITATAYDLNTRLPSQWLSFQLERPGTAQVFLDSLMNHIHYQKEYDSLVNEIESTYKINNALQTLPIESLLEVNTFPSVDVLLINWINKELNNQNLNSTLSNLTIDEIINKRLTTHFGSNFKDKYLMLKYANKIIELKFKELKSKDTLRDYIKDYEEGYYLADLNYRKFYEYYDKIEDSSDFEELRELVENIYTNEYLEPLTLKWNEVLKNPASIHGNPLQRNFYRDRLKNNSARTVVIISDALRYEIGRELYENLNKNPKFSPQISSQLATLPSYTSVGMAALLPHTSNSLQIDNKNNYFGLIDNQSTGSTKEREQILKNPEYGKEKSKAILYEDFNRMNKEEMRQYLKGQEVVYIYHDQIDARGEEARSEDEVFSASAEAVKEIYNLINSISMKGNTYNFIITSDHGFLYRRNPVQDAEKISLSGIDTSDMGVTKRSIISSESLNISGTLTLPLGSMLSNNDERVLTLPINHNIFAKPGPGNNYVHGGSSPQEMIIPVVEVKVDRGKVETRPAEVRPLTQINKITNRNVNIEFKQTEPVSDIVKERAYRLYFMSEDNELISNELLFNANITDSNPNSLTKKFRFNFKEQKFDKSKNYFLIIEDDETNYEVYRQKVIMDILFGDDYGFGF